nr:acylneuraminate cytidylyltransferase family protein [Fibrobacterota bacterium]
MAFRQKQVLALVPARGGSKGVLRKNLRRVHGKPLVEHTLEAAKGSRFVDKVYLSSDDEEILDVGRALQVEAFKRIATAASDTATSGEVVGNFIDCLPRGIIEADPFIAYLQPTSPLRNSGHIDAAFM